MGEIEAYVAQYGDYLADIQKRVFRTVILFSLVFGAGFLATGPLLRWFLAFLDINNATIVATSPFQLIDLAMSVGIFCAMIITIPFIVYQIYDFLHAGLFPNERRLFLSFIPLGIVLFSVGFAYGFAIMYFALALIASVNVGLGVVNLWDIQQFVSQIMITSTLLGVLFEIPLVLSFLIHLDVLSVQFLKARRPHAVVLILVVVALLPPTDGLSFVVMSVPLLVIYELVILLNSFKRPARISPHN
jgi:sec-independent protein translocase protein TatC